MKKKSFIIFLLIFIINLSLITYLFSSCNPDEILINNVCYQNTPNNKDFILQNKLYRVLTIVPTFNSSGYYFVWPYILIESENFNPENFSFYVKFNNIFYQLYYLGYFHNIPDRYYNLFFMGRYIDPPATSFDKNKYVGTYDFYIINKLTNEVAFHRSVNISDTNQTIVLPLPQNIQITNDDIPEISWDPVEGADLYLIKIYKYNTEENKPDTLTPYYGSNYIFDTKFDLKEIKSINLLPGKYSVRIQSIAYPEYTEKYGIICETTAIGTSYIYTTIELKKPLLSNGWYLLGAPTNLTTSQLDKNYQNTNKTVWKWNNVGWEVYTNDETINELINNYGIKTFTEIKKGEGYWVYIEN